MLSVRPLFRCLRRLATEPAAERAARQKHAATHKADDPLPVTPALHKYILDHSLREPDVLRRLRLRTSEHPQARMQSAPEQNQFFRLLLAATGAQRVLEIGVFTGYATLSFAMALPPTGKVIALDRSPEFVDIGRPFWAEAGVAHKIDVRLAPAAQTLAELIAAPRNLNSFDFVFIDADKENYPVYYEDALALVKPNGIIAIDNTLWYGRVLEPPSTAEQTTRIIQNLNTQLHSDHRVDISLLPIGDGVTLARKRPPN
eukprot:TRINITY_DN3442_c0_g1_i1.p1 TRINITY_DN3442_c0_g1~~TRINITY_DN3442_c0_g1_i1.p1  ORF type:complete len:258 (+),score=51.48 TRINITY_DN3442_c0_g1_i1:33-806(+)